MKSFTPYVSIITVNFNQAAVTEALIQSLLHLHYPHFEVLVIDNGSTEDSSWLAAKYPHIRWIRSETNLGFAGGNNLGLGHAQGDYFLFINNDMEVEPDFLEPLLLPFLYDVNATAASPLIKYFDDPTRIQYAGGKAMDALRLKNVHEGCGAPDHGQYRQIATTDYAHGACMLVSRATLKRVGYMSEDFFLYYEEQDWCERMIRCGGVNYMVPQSVVYHKESVSTVKGSPLKTYYLTRNRILFARKNFRGFSLMLAFAYVIFATIPYNTLKLFPSMPHLKAFYRGIGWHFFHRTTFNY